jgi:hypothetical protein
MTGKEIIFESWNEHLLEEEKARLANIQKLIDFYNGEHEKYITPYLNLKKLDKFPYYETNITKRIIKKVAEVYKVAPIRYFKEKQNDKYNEITQRKNIRMKTIERQSRLLGTLGVQPIVVEKNGKKTFDYLMLRSFTAYLEGLKPKAIKYLVADDGEEKHYAFWDDEQHLILNSDNIPVDPKPFGFEDEENPYGVIPFVWCPNDFLIEDFYNTGGSADDLINANLQIDLMLSEMAHKYRYIAFNPIWGKGNVKSVDVDYRYDEILWLDDPDAEIGNLSTDHNFASDIELLKLQMQIIKDHYGLSFQWGISGNTSGFALVVQNIDHKDDLENMVDVCRDWENDLLEMERIVGRVHGVTVPDKDFRIDYAEVSTPISIEEQNKKWDFEFKNKLSSRADYWRAQNPDISDEQIEEKQLKIAEENKTVKIAEQTEPTVTDLFNA